MVPSTEYTVCQILACTIANKRHWTQKVQSIPPDQLRKECVCVCVLILAHQEYLVIKKERKLKYVFSQCKFFRLIIKKHTS